MTTPARLLLLFVFLLHISSLEMEIIKLCHYNLVRLRFVCVKNWFKLAHLDSSRWNTKLKLVHLTIARWNSNFKGFISHNFSKIVNCVTTTIDAHVSSVPNFKSHVTGYAIMHLLLYYVVTGYTYICCIIVCLHYYPGNRSMGQPFGCLVGNMTNSADKITPFVHFKQFWEDSVGESWVFPRYQTFGVVLCNDDVRTCSKLKITVVEEIKGPE